MRISKTSILVIVLLSSLSLTLISCGNKTQKTTTTDPVPVPSTPSSNNTGTSNTQSNNTQNIALLNEINTKLDLLTTNLTIVHAQQNKPMVEFYKSPTCTYILVAQQQLVELGNSGSVSNTVRLRSRRY